MTAVLFSAGCASRVPLEPPTRPPSEFPQIMRFVPDPTIIDRGEKAILRWDGSEEVVLEEALDVRAGTQAEFRSLGEFPAQGTLEVWPKATTTYVVSCGDQTIGCSSASVRVRVK